MAGRVIRSLTLSAAFVVSSCSRPAPPSETQVYVVPPSASASPSPAVTVAASDGDRDAAKYFKMKCVVCHGTTGSGDGPGAAALDPKPRIYSDPVWQNSVTDEQIEKVIVGGGASVGKSAAMAPNPDLASKPEILKGLVKLIRGFKKG